MGLSAETYVERLTVGTCPERITKATLELLYSNETLADPHEAFARYQGLLDDLMLLAKRGLWGATGVTAQLMVPSTGRGVRVELVADELPRGMVLMAMRTLIRTHDSDPDDLAGLIALIGEEEARAVYGGFDFQTGVQRLTVSFEGEGSGAVFDVVHAGDGIMTEASRLTLSGLARAMPDAATEDVVLRLSGIGAFVPLGQPLDGRLGEEEWFVAGDDLVIDNLLMETACLDALLDMLSSEHRG